MAALGDFNAQRTLPRSGQHERGLEHLGNARLQVQSLESCCGKHDAVVQTLVKLLQTGIEVAAQRFNAQIRAQSAQQCHTAQTGGAHDSALWQVGEIRIAGRHPGVSRVLALHHTGQGKPGWQLHRHVFERMHRQIGATLFQRSFQLFDKQAFTTDFAQRAVQNLVALGCHAQ